MPLVWCRFVTIGHILQVFGFFAGEKVECGEL
jgi:hypothetical protein